MEIMPTHFFRFFEVMISLCLMDGGRMSFLSANFHCRGGVGVIHFFFLFWVCSGFYLIRWLTRFSSLSLSSHWWLMELHSCWAEMCFSPTCRPDPQKFVNGPPASTVDKICCFFFLPTIVWFSWKENNKNDGNLAWKRSCCVGLFSLWIWSIDFYQFEFLKKLNLNFIRILKIRILIKF